MRDRDEQTAQMCQAIGHLSTIAAAFGRANDGLVTIEEDPRTHKHEAFFWDADMGHEHLQTMWMDGHYFVRRFLT